MERRRTNRRTVNLKAERISCTENCSVFIENISETGIYMITTPGMNHEFEPGKEIDLELELSTGKVINLSCNIKWAFDGISDDQTNSVGLEIVNPPEEYRQFLKTFH